MGPGLLGSVIHIKYCGIEIKYEDDWQLKIIARKVAIVYSRLYNNKACDLDSHGYRLHRYLLHHIFFYNPGPKCLPVDWKRENTGPCSAVQFNLEARSPVA
jgi:hypothetical protein